jgi:NAD(P)-dependent dehydrogenase (short-subunit alcohol dehydrogenase family)
MSKTIVVTGGAGGIGADICKGMAMDGLNVVIADFNREAAETVAADICAAKGNAIAARVDVGDPASVAGMMEQSIARFGQVDYMFCGAGVMDRVPIIEMGEDTWDRLMRINLKGVFLCAQAAARHMIPRKEGRILSIASGRGVAGQARSAHYAASKAGVIAFTKSLAMEMAEHNVTANCVCPGATDTPMSRIGYTPEQFKKREEIPPLMDGLTHKFEIVGLVRYLLSDASKYITGQTFFLRTPK